MASAGEPSRRSSSILDLSGVRLSGEPLTTTPLHGGDDLVLMGREEDVTAVLRAVAALPGAVALPGPKGTGRSSGTSQGLRDTRSLLATWGSRDRVGRWLGEHTGVADPVQQQKALTRVGLATDVGPRTRLADLDSAARARVRIAAIVLVGESDPGVTHVVLASPLAGLPGHQRAGLRATLVRELRSHTLGAVLSTDSPVDALVLGARTIELDAEQVAQEGDPTTILGKPRGGLTAALAGANVMSGLARRGWLSIGHSQVKRRTDLDGKVYLAIPTDAVTLSVDEFDPLFSGEFVFEVIVIGVRDEGSLLQVRLSPADNEAGLPLVVDVLDASPRRAWSAITPERGGEMHPADDADGADAGDTGSASPGTWSLLQPGLGPDVDTQSGRIRVGSRLWAEVDTSRIHVWSVEV